MGLQNPKNFLTSYIEPASGNRFSGLGKDPTIFSATILSFTGYPSRIYSVNLIVITNKLYQSNKVRNRFISSSLSIQIESEVSLLFPNLRHTFLFIHLLPFIIVFCVTISQAIFVYVLCNLIFGKLPKNEVHAPYELCTMCTMYSSIGVSQSAFEWEETRDKYIGAELRIVICAPLPIPTTMWYISIIDFHHQHLLLVSV